ncbi:MAG: class I SAM-dependent RNA methyltransferase [Thermogemmatispora sp.]|uniref:class I SAM-dependent RNA methyltransferase n=1 Tax=Thermogemmatispora sp. TaxID=1968838 RepID=UPI00261F69EB|nr:class I SAM-dependent RNA methyltransferase [Thermogemmatispora sp.]MBX5458871.1 class I SAM-dependent RNA methyltransferase [Thermogemmatispora sp.]
MMEVERSLTYHTVTLGPLTRSGLAQAEIPDEQASGTGEAPTSRSRVVEVPAGLPGERVTIAIEKPAPSARRRRARRQAPPRVWISAIHEASPLRVPAPCPVFGTCGGCQLQHMRYDAQLAWKREVVVSLLSEIGGFDALELREIVRATEPCDVPWHYRNHMRFSVNREGQPGLTARGSHRVLPLSSCPIAHERINTVLGVLARHVNPRPQVLVRCGAATGQVLMQPAPAPAVAEELSQAGIEVHTQAIEERLAGETFRIRPSSFFQTNTAQAEKMARLVIEGLLQERAAVSVGASSLGQSQALPAPAASERRPVLADAYCGVGTFALLLARYAARVYAIEESPSAIEDAQWNLRHVNNVEILKGKVEHLLPTLAGQLDGLVLDPPRAGCQEAVLEALLQHPVTRIVYVSCDPSTLARDLQVLCRRQTTYRLLSVQPLDMFPQTSHIECIAILERQA